MFPKNFIRNWLKLRSLSIVVLLRKRLYFSKKPSDFNKKESRDAKVCWRR